MKKVLVSDYDKTFYLNESDIKENSKLLKEFRKDGNIFIFATGRSYSDFKSEIDKYNLEYDYLILNHGAQILDKNNNILKHNLLDMNIINELKEELYIEKSIKSFCCTIGNDRASFNEDGLIKASIKYEDTELLNSIGLNLKRKYNDKANIFIVSDHTLEIVSKDSSKFNALNFIINKFKLDKKSIYTIGDHETDVDMIKNYNGYTMEKCIDILKEYKKYSSVSYLIKDIMNEKV